MQNEVDEITKVICDVKTGVVLNTLRKDDDVKILTKEQKEYLKSYVEVVKTRDFIMLDRKACNKLSQEDFTLNESKLFWFIISHLGYFDLSCNLVKKNGINATDILTKADILRLGGFKPKSLERAIKGLIKKEIIKLDMVDNKRVYLANPFIFYRGKKVLEEYYMKFKDTKWYGESNIKY